MDKTVKYILIFVAGLVVVMIGVMFFMNYFGMPSGVEEMSRQKAVNDTNSGVPETSKSSDYTAGTYKDITTKELAAMLKKKDFVLVNVHIPYIGDIEGTDVSIPFNEIANNIDKLPADKDAKIVLYCQSGSMSAIAADTLSQLGYRNIYNVLGGMIQWQKDGNKLIINQQ